MKILIALNLGSLAIAIPSGELLAAQDALKDRNPLGQPFMGASLASRPAEHLSSPFNLFRRQGCDNMMQLCPGGCCGYDQSCCGNFCCNSGYLCVGFTPQAPCCVPFGSSDNTCGGSANSDNPCTRPGDVKCDGVDICCPPANACYYDTAGVPRCSPLSGPEPTPETTTSPDPIPTPTPTPTPTPPPIIDPGPNPTPTPTPTPDPTPPSYTYTPFWTPATIGGIAGGSVGGLILLVLLIWWCRRCCVGTSGGGTYIIHQPPKPISSETIYWLIKDLETPNAWQTFYTEEARRIHTKYGPNHPEVDPAAWMKDFATRAVSIRIQQMRDGGRRKWTWTVHGIAAWVPFGNTGLQKAGYDTVKRFRDAAIDAVGIGGNSEQMAALRAQASDLDRTTWLDRITGGPVPWVGKKVIKHWWEYSDLAAQVKVEMVDELATTIGIEAANEAVGVMVQWAPVAGHLVSSGLAVIGSNGQMVRALEWLEPVALEIHLGLFVANALTEVYGDGLDHSLVEKVPTSDIRAL